ncbi:MAG: ROK family glucokinase [Phycisphaerae bacterium]|nr:ROK family glucokinase [Phycisphaerae bacterium]
MSKYCIGVDLGGTFIKFCLLDEQRRASDIFQLPTPATGAKDVVAQMVAGSRQAIAKRGLSVSDIVGVGIGSPGPLKISEGIVIALPNIPGMDNLPLRDLVCKELGVPGVLENDANAAAFGEYICGAGAGHGDMVLLTLGTGVGGGIIIDGKVVQGSHEIGAEIGHVIVEPGGEKCGCGQRGCLERYASATYIGQWATRLVREGRASSLKAVLDAGGTITAKDINEARKAGDALSTEVWDQAMRYLALGCVTIARMLDPDEIVLAGGMTKAGEDMMAPLRKHYADLHWTLTPALTKLEIAQLGNDAGTIGAAGCAWLRLGGK